MTSPYAGIPQTKWLSITEQLVAAHPLQHELILESSLSAWNVLWKTTVGAEQTSIPLRNLGVPATVIGYFFELLLGRELEIRCPGEWRGSQSKSEKDLVYIPDQSLSVEVKTSGQAGYRVFGNRSYGQKTESSTLQTKEKSGYYVTANFFAQSLTLIRFGWIDADDWKSQSAPTGQMAGLSDAVYESKLIPLAGAYRADAPVEMLHGVGPATARELHELGIATIGELMATDPVVSKKVSRIFDANAEFLDGCRERSK